MTPVELLDMIQKTFLELQSDPDSPKRAEKMLRYVFGLLNNTLFISPSPPPPHHPTPQNLQLFKEMDGGAALCLRRDAAQTIDDIC